MLEKKRLFGAFALSDFRRCMMVLGVVAVHYSAIMIPVWILLVEMGRAVQFTVLLPTMVTHNNQS